MKDVRSRQGALYIDLTMISGNTVLHGYGGGGHVGPFGHAEITNSKLIDNNGKQACGCLAYVLGSGSMDNVELDRCTTPVAFGGAVCLYNPGYTFPLDFANLVVRNSSAPQGGAFWIMEARHVTMTGIKVESCTADAGGGLYLAVGTTAHITDLSVRNSRATDGGCVWASASSLTLQHAVLEGCTATEKGGGMLAGAGAQVTARSLTIRDSHAQQGGAIMAVDGAVVSMRNGSKLSACRATDGGLLYASGAALALSLCPARPVVASAEPLLHCAGR